VKTVIGIDFGTSTTVVAKRAETSRLGPDIIEIDGKKCTDTVMRFDAAGEKVEAVGEDAWDTAQEYPQTTFFERLRNLGISFDPTEENKTFEESERRSEKARDENAERAHSFFLNWKRLIPFILPIAMTIVVIRGPGNTKKGNRYEHTDTSAWNVAGTTPSHASGYRGRFPGTGEALRYATSIRQRTKGDSGETSETHRCCLAQHLRVCCNFL